ncbi:MAG: hypothetical protein V7719_11350 [Psychroserpens sp.]|uniref:hypothetical protein n=1 Tax=Psychroserpens sp. TaxID=2020870 RepID=UPI003002E169
MNKSLIAILFSLMFLSLVTAPTIVMAIDDTIDISFFYDISEEEEEKGNENNKEFEKFVVDLEIEIESFITSNNREHLGYTFKTYPKPHLNLISPPPEFIS